MITIAAAAAFLTVGIILFTLVVRPQDLPEAPPESPFKHLDEHKAAIYENLRDLQFEYRVGKLSEQDYQQTKLDLQRELASVLAEVDRLKAGAGVASVTKSFAAVVSAGEKQAVKSAVATVCPYCGAKFPQPLKFCGECGKPMAEQQEKAGPLPDLPNPRQGGSGTRPTESS